MIKSMTGYGRGKQVGEEYEVSVEIKTVNHRYCDIAVRAPREIMFLEDKIKKTIRQYVARGRVEVFINIAKKEGNRFQVKMDKNLATAYLQAVKELEELAFKQNIGCSFPPLLARFPDIISIDKEEYLTSIWQDLSLALQEALDNLVKSREDEGRELALSMQECLLKADTLVQNIEERTSFVIEEYRKRLQERVAEFLQEQEIEESRLLMEVVIFAEKSDITEELVRFKSHNKAFLMTLQQKEPVGRKMDFIVQEIYREINTIASKANDYEISSRVVEIKSEIEKIREQLQNIE